MICICTGGNQKVKLIQYIIWAKVCEHMTLTTILLEWTLMMIFFLFSFGKALDFGVCLWEFLPISLKERSQVRH